MVIVDTTVWIDYLGGAVNRETEWLERELTGQRLGLTDLTLCEVLQGFRDEDEFQRVRAELLTFYLHSTGGRRITGCCAGKALRCGRRSTVGLRPIAC